MTAATSLQSLWDKPFELLLALEARLRASGEERTTTTVRREWTGLAFELGEKQYLAPQTDISEVLEVPSLTRVPRARPWLMGVANVRGDLLPVIDLGRLMGSKETHITDNSRVVVFSDDEVPAGFLVDDVDGFRSFGVDDQRHELLQQEPLNELTQQFLLGAFVRDGNAWRVFSLQKLVADPVFQDAGI